MQLSNFMKSFSKQRTVLASTFDALDEIRAQIDAKGDEIEALRTAPRPVSDAIAAFDQWADRVATAAVDRAGISYMLGPEGRGDIRLPSYRAPGETTPNLTGSVEVLLGLLILTGRDKLRAVIEGQLADLAAGRETLDAEQRIERIASAEGDLRGLEMAEETIVRQMQNAGLAVVRRVDATALALLADDASLPS
ncbi:hypothetical protein D2N39_13045 [Gemmobacter lutimaris]|uniref:Uncharacterized protein n=1 Tax=Gemmobacter lutimaris TaxID=2306023 RepID=A0A398BPY8_9RHOB|nr:hypothetical protein [Gemmobacter lutimaris]RID91617.1 hypothetical protein D2N39_13045 [Gemmobacter lutimaris]